MLEATPHDAKRHSRYQRLTAVTTRLRLECLQEIFRLKSSTPAIQEAHQPSDSTQIAA
jgi:hypothetical protein